MPGLGDGGSQSLMETGHQFCKRKSSGDGCWGQLHSNEFAVNTVNCELKNKDGDSCFMYISSELRII